MSILFTFARNSCYFEALNSYLAFPRTVKFANGLGRGYCLILLAEKTIIVHPPRTSPARAVAPEGM